ncbi:MAG: hypothetical protein ACYDGM_13135 [Vulcanimicrobiaceae bacterium]
MIVIAVLATAMSCSAPAPAPGKQISSAMVRFAMPRDPQDEAEDRHYAVEAAQAQANGSVLLLFNHRQHIGVFRDGRLSLCPPTPSRVRSILMAMKSPRFGTRTLRALIVPYGQHFLRIETGGGYGNPWPLTIEPGHKRIKMLAPFATNISGYEAPGGDVWFVLGFSGKDGNKAGGYDLLHLNPRGEFTAYHMWGAARSDYGISGPHMVSDARGFLWVYTEMCRCIWRIDPKKL